MDGSLVLILHTHLPYVLRHGKWPHGSDWLCEAAAECYIPILNECNALMRDGITPNITLSISPVVLEQLADAEFPAIFNAYLDEKIESAMRDQQYFADRPTEAEYLPLASYWRDWYTDRSDDFNERYGRNLVAAIADLAERGAIALQTCGATHGYFPLLGRDESISAQLGLAVATHRAHFGDAPRGVWMPECAYRPCYFWTPPVPTPYAPSMVRKGVEQLIAEHGLEYTVVDSHLTRGGRPLGIYASRFDAVRGMEGRGERFLPLDNTRSIHDLYRVCSTGDPDSGMAAIFTRDAETTLQVWSGVYGYPGDPEYLEFHKKHHNSGHRYWRVTDSRIDLALKTEYRPELIDARIRTQAAHFVETVEAEMFRFRAETGRAGTLAAPFDTELFGHWWFEGPRFLGEVIRLVAASRTIRMRTAPDELDDKDPGIVIQIPEGSWGEGGAHDVWLNPSTEWTWPMIYEVEARFHDLVATRGSDPLENRILRQMARENLLLQASDWQFLITTGSASDYATRRFREHCDNAMLLAGWADSLRRDMPLSLEQTNALAELESLNRLFPDLRLDHWVASESISSQARPAFR
ncbi:MAG: 1,4-alpha-glucan branching protein domain-containing protein [Candidatus Kapaibacterium sp.]